MLELPLADRCAFLSEAGRRRVNQDSVLVTPLSIGTELVAVADGMGGRSGGEIASSRALEVLRAALAAGEEPDRAVRTANQAVYQHAVAHPELEGMGTTLVGVFRRDSQYSVVNVGDSRAYRVDGQGIHQLTEDHSFLAEARRSGSISLEEALKSPWRNAVTRAIGTEPDLQVDCFGPFDAREPHVVVLCSDGVYRTLSDDDLRLIVEARPLQEAVRAIAAAAYEGGSDDNISVALIRFGPPVSR